MDDSYILFLLIIQKIFKDYESPFFSFHLRDKGLTLGFLIRVGLFGDLLVA